MMMKAMIRTKTTETMVKFQDMFHCDLIYLFYNKQFNRKYMSSLCCMYCIIDIIVEYFIYCNHYNFFIVPYCGISEYLTFG